MTVRRFIDILNWEALVASGVMACKDGLLLAGWDVTGIDTESVEPDALAGHLRNIGFDLAREVHERVPLRHTVLLAPRRENSCERHALEYLRRTGFRIDETDQGGASFDITIDRMEDCDVAAVAEIGGSLRISRMYTPVQTGVLAASAVTVQQLDPDTYLARGARW